MLEGCQPKPQHDSSLSWFRWKFTINKKVIIWNVLAGPNIFPSVIPKMENTGFHPKPWLPYEPMDLYQSHDFGNVGLNIPSEVSC